MVLYDRANRRGKVDEIEDKESSDEERFILPYNDEPDDSVESEGSDSTETERLPAQKKRGSLMMIPTMTVLRYSMKVTSEDGGRDSGSISGGCDTNHNSDRIVIKLRKK